MKPKILSSLLFVFCYFNSVAAADDPECRHIHNALQHANWLHIENSPSPDFSLVPLFLTNPSVVFQLGEVRCETATHYKAEVIGGYRYLTVTFVRRRGLRERIKHEGIKRESRLPVEVILGCLNRAGTFCADEFMQEVSDSNKASKGFWHATQIKEKSISCKETLKSSVIKRKGDLLSYFWDETPSYAILSDPRWHFEEAVKAMGFQVKLWYLEDSNWIGGALEIKPRGDDEAAFYVPPLPDNDGFVPPGVWEDLGKSLKMLGNFYGHYPDFRTNQKENQYVELPVRHAASSEKHQEERPSSAIAAESELLQGGFATADSRAFGGMDDAEYLKFLGQNPLWPSLDLSTDVDPERRSSWFGPSSLPQSQLARLDHELPLHDQAVSGAHLHEHPQGRPLPFVPSLPSFGDSRPRLPRRADLKRASSYLGALGRESLRRSALSVASSQYDEIDESQIAHPDSLSQASSLASVDRVTHTGQSRRSSSSSKTSRPRSLERSHLDNASPLHGHATSRGHLGEPLQKKRRSQARLSSSENSIRFSINSAASGIDSQAGALSV